MRCVANQTTLFRWMEWLTIPIQYCDLPLSSQLAITIWDLAGPGKAVPFGGTTVSLFEKDKCVSLPSPQFQLMLIRAQ